MKVFWIVVIFLVIGGFIISKSYNLEEKEDQKTFLKSFGKWVLDLGKNVKDVTSYTIKEHDWLPKINETNKNPSRIFNDENSLEEFPTNQTGDVDAEET